MNTYYNKMNEPDDQEPRVYIDSERLRQFMHEIKKPRPPEPPKRELPIEAAYRRLAILLHPDKPTGSTEAMQDLVTIMTAARKEKDRRTV